MVGKFLKILKLGHYLSEIMWLKHTKELAETATLNFIVHKQTLMERGPIQQFKFS